jgi:toxin FitB
VNLIDSSAWLEYFAGGPNASFFSAAIEDEKRLIILRQAGKKEALEKTAAMRQGKVVDLTSSLAIQAASLSLKHGLAMADSIVLATARGCQGVLWTQDADFEELPSVKFRAKR